MIHTNRILVCILLLVAAVATSACGGSAEGTTLADVVEQVTQAGADGGSVSTGAANSAKATVSARSLRVRAEPSPSGEVVGGIREGEVYDVVGLSSDGEWIQLSIPDVEGGSGWVSANFVSVQGAITEASITEAPASEAPGASGGINLPTPTPRAAEQIAAGPGTATVQTEGVRLRVRAEPSAEAEIVGYVYDGEVYEVVSATDDGLWTEIAGRLGTDNVNGGWVSTEFLVLN
jgi:uncharacterized protein YgiM (DUF1202 family)